MNEVLIGGIEKREIVIADYDPRWPRVFQKHAGILSRVLGSRALAIEHVGSTSVPGLAAKPIIDIDVIVDDSSDEATYLPEIVRAGYVLRVWEPDWHQHRMFRTPKLDVHVHLFSPGCVEFTRHLAFRDQLRSCPEDRLLEASLRRKPASTNWSEAQIVRQRNSRRTFDVPAHEATVSLRQRHFDTPVLKIAGSSSQIHVLDIGRVARIARVQPLDQIRRPGEDYFHPVPAIASIVGDDPPILKLDGRQLLNIGAVRIERHC